MPKTGKVTILYMTALNKMQNTLGNVVERLETLEEKSKRHKKLVKKIKKLCEDNDK